MEKTFTISEMSKYTGLSKDTIRYYEKIALVTPSERDKNGYRVYSENDYNRMMFIVYLKNTDMPLKRIKEYLKYTSEQNYNMCYTILEEHKYRIENKVNELNTVLNTINYKLSNYQELKDKVYKR